MNPDQFNPYASTTSADSVNFSDQSTVSAAVVDQLRRTGGWTRLFSIILWVFGGFMILAGIIMVVGRGFLPEVTGIAASIGVFYVLLAFIHIYPAMKLGKYAAACKRLPSQPSETVLIDALNQQRAFWKYVGIWATILLSIWGGTIVLGIIGAFLSAAK